MDCPKCNNSMNEISGPSFSAMKCGACSGIWFQDGGHEKAKALEESVKIDETETNAAAVYNPERDINCPECKQKMMKMTDSAQLHIQFEACPDCNGVFFDSGEFKDFSEFTFIEKIEQVIETVRTNLK